MAVTFNFGGANVTEADPEHGTVAVHDNTRFVESDVTFFYSSTGNSGLAEDAGGFADNLIWVSAGTGTLAVGNTDPSKAFLSNVVINVQGYLNTNPPDDVSIVFSNTVNDTRHTEVLAVGFNFTTPFNVTAPADTAYNKIIFKAPSVGNDALFINSITAEPMCVLGGTRFVTDTGAEVAVEDLQPGDRIRTADGETTVKWVGQQAIDTQLTHPGRVNPVCIRAGALAEGLPARDIYLSGDHAIGIDGILVNAGALLNGSSIFRVAEMPRAGFTYYHVETDAHELLLTEGIGVESFIDYLGRDGFDNAPPALTARIREMPRARVSAPRLLPAALRARLDARAQALAMPEAA